MEFISNIILASISSMHLLYILLLVLIITPAHEIGHFIIAKITLRYLDVPINLCYVKINSVILEKGRISSGLYTYFTYNSHYKFFIILNLLSGIFNQLLIINFIIKSL